jgi:hypothetical protein
VLRGERVSRFVAPPVLAGLVRADVARVGLAAGRATLRTALFAGRVALDARDVFFVAARFAVARFVVADFATFRGAARLAVDFFVADVRVADFFDADFLVTDLRAAAAFLLARFGAARFVVAAPTRFFADFAVFDFADVRADFVRRFVVAIRVLRLRVVERADSAPSVANAGFTSIK